jgi:hypothetical protein
MRVKPDSIFDDFDSSYYLLTQPDVAAAGVDPAAHFAAYGWHEGRLPDGLFDPAYYLAQNPDVAAAGVDPLQHYMQYGWHEGRNPSASFNTNAYLAANPDVAAAGVDPCSTICSMARSRDVRPRPMRRPERRVTTT